MRKSIILLFLFATLCLNAQDKISLIPYPNQLMTQDGHFEIKSSFTVKVPHKFKSEFDMMSDIFEEEYSLKLINSRRDADLIFKINPELAKEEYILNVTKSGIESEVSSPEGCFLAFQTIRQLLVLTASGSYYVPACKIVDKPAFSWRGIMVDAARTFLQKSAIKSLLDEMALLKLNVFHWHLTDNQGWRIEIKKYPKLTEIGAWRDSCQMLNYPLPKWQGEVWDNIQPAAYHKLPYGGFYYQDDIKEIVEYASKRHITIIPEIDMPGHSKAAIKAYPWLRSNNAAEGTDIGEVEAINIIDSKVVSFYEDVLKEVMALFPSEVIHIGGDEVKHKEWQNNKEIEAYMKEHHIENYTDLQMGFINHISNFITQNGRRMMGWNEIYGKNVRENVGEFTMKDSNLKLDRNAIVQFWKGKPELFSEVLEKGYDIVYSESTYTYTTFSYRRISLNKAYSSSPVPESVSPENAKNVLGIECPMWSENSVRTIGFYPYVFPRIAAYSEVGWTKKSNKDYTRFTDSLWRLKKHWDEKGILYNDDID